MSVISDGLDPVIHPIQRLRICALLEPVTEEQFGAVRDLLGISDSALSKHVLVLVEAGYLEPTRAGSAGRRRVWLRLTPGGRMAFRRHIAALHSIAANSETQDVRQDAVHE